MQKGNDPTTSSVDGKLAVTSELPEPKTDPVRLRTVWVKSRSFKQRVSTKKAFPINSRVRGSFRVVSPQLAAKSSPIERNRVAERSIVLRAAAPKANLRLRSSIEVGSIPHAAVAQDAVSDVLDGSSA